nr:T9SS type A sorting domain-containing protein [Ferruginibacter sp.]
EPFSYTDQAALSGNVFYRIKSVEVTGVVTYSNIVKLTSDVADMKLKSITPNPVVNQAQLSIVTPKKDVVTIAVVSMEGKILQRISIQLQSGTTIVNLDMSNLQPGVYMIRGNFQSNGNANTLRFVKQ